MIFGSLGVDFGPLRANFEQLDVIFWPCEWPISALLFELEALGVDFWCLVAKFKTLGIVSRPLSDDLRPPKVYFRPLGIDFRFEMLILDLSHLSLGFRGNICQIWRVRPLRVNFMYVGLYF